MTATLPGKTYLISRTDAIGDVVLTLPMAGWLKQHVPGARVLFLGRTYTAPVIAACRHVDVFLNWDEINILPVADQISFFREQCIDTIIHVFPDKEIARRARQAGISTRIGTRNRWFHWFTASQLVSLSRRHSPLHESQLNLALLRPVGLIEIPALATVSNYLDLSQVLPLPDKWEVYLQPAKPKIILHPKSKGSAREWGLDYFAQLARHLHHQGWQVIITGSPAEHELLQPWLRQNQAYITDLTGQLSLPEFISLIKVCDGLVGASTGPLHLAAGLGIHALGLYPPIKPMHPGRWAPIGVQAEFLVLDKNCEACRQAPAGCTCIQQLSVAEVAARVARWK
ncbi:MAG: hypothetical protein AVDCRST_MAG95-3147 [uncultured Adhaeribacter sp.]|uniref:ADP-heptose--lipooligosaccharide heptosyltransferase II n=1 Tax=uncultured Adhaeribacter sp. TaxID=448109 RepID=A0A6J4JJG4_9BACT|nr:MAG: hypothetical protein AVDCRST_MAG95-3147 [uncultured Adhaeribacter sp.]